MAQSFKPYFDAARAYVSKLGKVYDKEQPNERESLLFKAVANLIQAIDARQAEPPIPGPPGPPGERGLDGETPEIPPTIYATITAWLRRLTDEIAVLRLQPGQVGPGGDRGLDGVAGAPGADGADSTVPGPPGADGQDGSNGVGVPAAGTTGQLLKKLSNTNYDTAWYSEQHADLGGIGTDDHHAKAHVHLADGSGTVGHSSLSGIGADDHHAQAHTLASHSTKAHSELSGVGANDHHAQAHGNADHTVVGTPGSSAFADVAAQGSSASVARLDHVHGREANPVTAHEAAGDPHTGYRLESADHSHVSTGIQGGVVSHADLGTVTANQHHNQAHSNTDHTDFGDPNDPGTVTLATERTLIQSQRLKLSGSERLTAAGTGRMVLTDAFAGQPTVYLGTPKTPNVSFTVATNYSLDQMYRLTLNGTMRATLEGTADLVLTDDFGTRSRITLAGRG